jgi:preprotein translocase subunit SecG
MYQALLIVHILIAVSIIGLVLIQQGRGADAGAGFGGGASGTLFGARGAASFLSRTTAILALLFFTSSLVLAYLSDKKDNNQKDLMDAPPASESVQPDLPPVMDKAPTAEEKLDLPENPDLPTPEKDSEPKSDKE